MAKTGLGLQRSIKYELMEQRARNTLREVKSEGHPYIDLRVDGGSYVFYCTLCFTSCFGESSLRDHLGGKTHSKMYDYAKATLIGKNHWPFDDGILFFYKDFNDEKLKKDFNDEDKYEDEPSKGNVNVNLLLDDLDHVDDLAIVVHNGNEGNGCFGDASCSYDEDVVCGEKSDVVVIPGVIGKEGFTDLPVRLIGSGMISARLSENDGVHRIWCEWLGNNDEIQSNLPVHDFAVVTFDYYLELGKYGFLDEIRTLLLTRKEHSDSGDGSTKRRKKSNSYSEDASKTSSYRCDSSGEASQALTTTASSALRLHRHEDQLRHPEIASSKTLRNRVRKQHLIAAERACDICQLKMLPGKDVATLLNLKTGKLACSSRNVHGAFHVFHTSCLVHWILLHEFEMLMNPPEQQKAKQRPKRRTKYMASPLGKECRVDNTAKRKKTRKESEVGTLGNQFFSVFCTDCQGTGLQIEGDKLEMPTVPPLKMDEYKISVSHAHKKWMVSPEVLENCSIGFAFPEQADYAKGMVTGLKLLQFYREDEDHCRMNP